MPDDEYALTRKAAEKWSRERGDSRPSKAWTEWTRQVLRRAAAEELGIGIEDAAP